MFQKHFLIIWPPPIYCVAADIQMVVNLAPWLLCQWSSSKDYSKGAVNNITGSYKKVTKELRATFALSNAISHKFTIRQTLN